MKQASAGKTLRADLIVIVGLLLLAAVLWLVLSIGREEGGVAVVRVDGVETERHLLSVDGVFPLNGGSNILVIEDGQAWLSEANCPDLLCVKQGKIHYTGQVITCLPNRLTVTVESGESNGVDFTVG
ncbi:MAG: NusG domain II-containing protein [Oscillospiraceae bacterium]|nr:NusG domain II-containing protein [Oscillospiraceae bacterium]